MSFSDLTQQHKVLKGREFQEYSFIKPQHFMVLSEIDF